MTKTYPLLMSPAIHAMPWGGTRIRDVLGKSIPGELAGSPIGESWEVSAHPGGVSRVANGALAGRPLDEVVGAWGETLLGPRVAGRHCGSFPLIVKLIEVNALASVQVHPDEAHAMRAERCPYGKSEAWYIIEAGPGPRPGWVCARASTGSVCAARCTRARFRPCSSARPSLRVTA